MVAYSSHLHTKQAMQRWHDTVDTNTTFTQRRHHKNMTCTSWMLPVNYIGNHNLYHSIQPRLVIGYSHPNPNSSNSSIYVLVRRLSLPKHRDCSNCSTSTIFGPELDMAITYQFLEGVKLGYLCRPFLINPRWRTAAILKNWITAVYPHRFDQSAQNLEW